MPDPRDGENFVGIGTDPGYGGTMEPEPVFDPGAGYIGEVGDEGEIVDLGGYDEVDPIFSFKSSEFNLKYNKLIPFVGVYLLYCFIMR
jgi:hypothetical protein